MPPRSRESPIVLKPERLLGGMPSSGVLDAEGVHTLRRVSKEARAVLRLAEDAGRTKAKPVRCELTRAAKPFAPLRDAAVVANLADKLAGKAKGKERAAARAMAATTPPERPRAWWTQQWRRMAKLRRDLQRLDDTPLSPAEIGTALAKSVRRVCKRAERVHPDRQFKRAHAWRKTVKLLRSQLQAIPLRSPSLQALSDQLKEIAHCLGVAADCEALIAAVEAHRWPADMRKAAKALQATARKKQTRAVRRACQCWAKAKPDLKMLRKP